LRTRSNPYRAPTVKMDRTSIDEAGSVAVETAIMAPALVFLLLLVVFAGRVAQADGDVRRAAAAAARAASLRQTPADAATSAREAAGANLAANGVGCGRLETDVDTSNFTAGGTVAVTVRCIASMADVSGLGVPGQRTFTARSIEVIDRYRGGDR
jgi:Flp pilus assembly protein TadG